MQDSSSSGARYQRVTTYSVMNSFSLLSGAQNKAEMLSGRDGGYLQLYRGTLRRETTPHKARSRPPYMPFCTWTSFCDGSSAV